MRALPARASWAAETASAGAEGAPGRAAGAENRVGVEAPVVPPAELVPAPIVEIGDPPVAAGGRDVLGGAEARRGVGRRRAHARVRAIEPGPRDGRVAPRGHDDERRLAAVRAVAL